jgi:SprT-like protein
MRAQRTAGATKYEPESDEITISLTWDAYEQNGWEQFNSTARHELTRYFRNFFVM